MADSIEEIKARLDLVDVIKEYMPVQLAGANFKARCPFHQEKSASFMISPSKQIWHCFGCSEGGDLFKFVMKQEGMEFGEALRHLAQKAGVQLERRDPRVQGEKNRLLEALDIASQYFHQALVRAPKAASIRAYLEKRGIDQAQIDEFRIGYSLPEFDALYNFLVSRKFTVQEILSAGLVIKKEQGYGCYDRFRNRIMVPIRNVNGDVVGFGARILDEKEDGPKYLNSPQSMLYDKSKVVFGLDKAKYEIRQKNCAVLVEGYMDVLAVHRTGMKNVVAISGTALTEEQVKLLKRFTPHFLFSFDTDAAGNQATMRGIERALREGCDVKIIQLPRTDTGTLKYKDPDECIKKNPDEWRSAVENAVSFLTFYCERIISPKALADAFEKKSAARTILNLIALLPDAIEQDHWIRELSRRLSIGEQVLWDQLRVPQKRAVGQHTSSPSSIQSTSEQSEIDELFLALLIKYPVQGIERLRSITSEMFPSKDHQTIYENLKDRYTLFDGKENFDGFHEKLAECIEPRTLELYLLRADKEYSDGDEGMVAKALSDMSKKIKDRYVKERIFLLQQLIRQAETEHDSEALARYAQEFETLQTM